MKYTLQDFLNISFDGFNFVIPEETVDLISSLYMEVGSPTYIKTPIFKKRDTTKDNNATFGASNNKNIMNKRRKGNKNVEISNEEWETIRTFQPTKIEHKIGLDGEIDQIRLLLNKLSDKTFVSIRDKIFNIIDTLIENNLYQENMEKVGIAIFDMASSNKFYSKIYADLYSDLLKKYEFIRPIFDSNYASYINIFKNIEYVDADKDYDGFCEMNKINDKRKALSTFFVNLTLNDMISKNSLSEITYDLIKMVIKYVSEPNRKNEVDELTENIAILYHKDIISTYDHPVCPDYYIEGQTITQIISKFAKSKSKDYSSLSNKSIFKFMDLVDM